MAHYALVDASNIVVEVFVGRDEDDIVEGINSWEEYYSNNDYTCKRTSYNTKGNLHSLGGEPYRKNYAGLGYTYDEIRDAFIPPKPFNSWVLDEDKCLWNPPIPYPTDGEMYRWDEETISWLISEQVE